MPMGAISRHIRVVAAGLYSILLILAGCGGSLTTVVNAVLLGDAHGTHAYVSVLYGNLDVIDDQVAINDTYLSFGLPIDFQTDSGLSVNLIAPLYYADMTPLGPGDTAEFTVWDWSGYYTIYQHDTVVMPGQVELVEPSDGASIDANADVTMRWNGAGSLGYVARYLGDSVDDAGLYVDYLPTGNVAATVPTASTVPGDAAFAVDAVNGDAFIFGRGDNVESFFLVGTSDEVDATVVDATDTSVAGAQELSIAATYARDAGGLRFTVRETDPQQIAQPCTVTVGITLQEYAVGIAFVSAYDANGYVFYSWMDKQIYRSENAAYAPSFEASAGTTVVIGTHGASYRGGTYSY